MHTYLLIYTKLRNTKDQSYVIMTYQDVTEAKAAQKKLTADLISTFPIVNGTSKFVNYQDIAFKILSPIKLHKLTILKAKTEFQSYHEFKTNLQTYMDSCYQGTKRINLTYHQLKLVHQAIDTSLQNNQFNQPDTQSLWEILNQLDLKQNRFENPHE